ncbi:serine hydrolase [Pseudomonas sp. PDM17]|uniref:serine hydrolase n=1 Tax=Pseudomonas sp. PDM17 TaxID=2769285 RepID=UPI0017806305|nr:serine hydrolase [Pseudomonas sp. PDM17]MBD9502743.1 serine hydrolase [Pseudomonas sp. PDM17]
MTPSLRKTLISVCLLSSITLLPVHTFAAQAADATLYSVNRGDPALKAGGKYIDQMVSDFMKKNDLPGLSMAIVQAPYIPRAAGYGLATASNDELASIKTSWNVGQITQAFTAVAIFQLVEMGKLDVSEPVSRYITDAPRSWHDITILELMQHASGIPDFRHHGYKADQAYTPEELIDLVKDSSLLFKPGTNVRDSATDFILLGKIVEKVSGMSYEDFVWKYQIKPLDLKNTMFPADMATRVHLDRPTPTKVGNQHSKFKADQVFIDPSEAATGYRSVNGKNVAVGINESKNLYAYGGIWSSAEDISRWDIALAGSVLLKDAAHRDTIYKPAKLKNGSVVPAMAGWEFTRHPGFLEIKGSNAGFSAYLSRFTAGDELVCVTLITNKQDVDMTALGRDIAEAYKPGLGSGLDSDKVVNLESKFSVDETITRLKEDLALHKVPVFAEFDHEKNSRGTGSQLRPTKVLVLGNPNVGSKVMLDKQGAALDLPLRVAVWQDERGRVWAGYENLDQLSQKYGITDTATLDKMTRFMNDLLLKAVSVYQP